MSLSAEKILSNFEKHQKIVKTYIGERQEQVLSMIDTLGENYVMALASGKSWYHSAFPVDTSIMLIE